MNADELKEERIRRDLTQAEMAQFLGVKYSTYVKWETDKNRKKPLSPLISAKLEASQDLDLSVLSIREIAELELIAREKGVPMVELIGNYIREGMQRAKGIVPLLLLLFVLIHQMVDGHPRRFGSRRRQEMGEVCAPDCEAEV